MIVMMTVDEEGNCLDGASAETAATKLTAWGADAIGCNCSAGPATVLSVIERMRPVTTLPLVAMPNAGMPRAVEGRKIYLTSPEYMASFARKLVKAGASIVGGCCGTTPSYTRAMKSALRAMDAMEAGAQVMEKAARRQDAAVEVKNKVAPPPLEERSKIGRDDRGGRVRADGGDCFAEGDRLQQGDWMARLICTSWAWMRSTCRIRRGRVRG